MATGHATIMIFPLLEDCVILLQEVDDESGRKGHSTAGRGCDGEVGEEGD